MQQRESQQREASERNARLQEKITAQTSARRQARKFAVGNYVVIPNANPTTKTKPRFKGPYKITDVYPNDRYRI
jgi:hypothetical protein